jgi:preprotein translocase subunit SecG
MQWLSPVLLAIQVVSSLSIIVLVLLQQGKGADMGSSFGGGSAGSLFGSTGAANFLSRATKWAAIIFFVSTGGLAYVAHHPAGKSILDGGVMQGFETPATPSGSAVPRAPGSAVPGQSSVPTAPAASVPATPAVPTAPAVPEAPAAADAPSAVEAPAVEAPAATDAPATPAN